MATISTLAVNLIARTSAFERGMKRGRKSVKGFKNSINGAVASVARFAKRLALIAGVGAMGFFLKTTLKSLDAVSKLSRRIGISTEALLGLRFAAGLAGVETQALDKSLEIFVRRMGEVKSGSGEAKRGLEALGLSAEQMIAATPDQALLIVADRIQELGTQAEKSAAAYFLFGRAGAQLLNLFEGGSAGIIKATKEAEKFGLTLKGFDLTKVEEANDAISRMTQSFRVMFTEVVVRITPAIKKLADFFTTYRDTIISTTKNMAIFALKAFLMVKAIKLVVGAVRVIIGTYKVLRASQITFLALSGPAGWAVLAAGIGIATAAIIAMNKVMDKAIEKIKTIATVSKPKVPVTAGLSESIAQTEKEIITLRKQLGGIKETIDGAGKKLLTQPVLVDLSKPIAQTEKEIITLFKIIQGIKRTLVGLGEGVIERSIPLAILQKRLDNSKKHLLLLLEQRDIQGDIALAELKQAKAAEKKQTAFAKLMSNVRAEADNIIKFVFDKIDADAIKSVFDLSEQAKKLKETLQTPAEKLSKVKDKLSDMFQRGFLTAKEFTKALKSARDNLIPEAPTDTATGRFQQIRSAFIDVAALNPAQTPTAELVKLNDKTEKTNFLLEELNRNSIGVHQT